MQCLAKLNPDNGRKSDGHRSRVLAALRRLHQFLVSDENNATKEKQTLDLKSNLFNDAFKKCDGHRPRVLAVLRCHHWWSWWGSPWLVHTQLTAQVCDYSDCSFLKTYIDSVIMQLILPILNPL